jgi:hypothetical protein
LGSPLGAPKHRLGNRYSGEGVTLDLNFVDPPIDGRLDPYDLGIAKDAIGGELDSLAESFSRAEVRRTLPEQLLDQIQGAARQQKPDCLALYGEALPFVARYLRVELDTQTPGKNGIGRIRDGDPPPRFGGKYRRPMRRETARLEVGLNIERLILAGFQMFLAAFFEGSEIGESQLKTEERYRAWVRTLNPLYLDCVAPERPDESMVHIFFQVIAPAVMDPFEESCSRNGIGKGIGRRATFAPYFFSVGWSLAGTFSGVLDETA